MCGIAGLFAYHPAAPSVDRAALQRTSAHMAARGPDAQGEWVAADDRVALAHRRLAIIDLSPGGAQPMASADGQLVISFNGEIYNHRELRAALEREGAVFRSHSDTEVLLQLYARKGRAMLPLLRGMFAFALWDGRSRSLLLARDAFGIKPLYLADDGRTLRLASQVKALLAGGGIDTAPEPAGHAGFFLWGSVPEPYTLYRGIRSLPAGHSQVFDARGPQPPEAFGGRISERLAAAAAKELALADAEAHRDEQLAQLTSVEFRAELPKTTVGKVLRRALAEEAAKRSALCPVPEFWVRGPPGAGRGSREAQRRRMKAGRRGGP
jgi:asparagine synthase (glutamine-hydrolysing)